MAATRFVSGLLEVGAGHEVYFEDWGNADGKSVLVLHGGPGSGSSRRLRRWFNPDVHRVVTFDQRNCGRSRPSAAEPDVDLSRNTTQDLIADCEMLRSHLGIERWLVWGGSWGTTLALAYAEAHPASVSEMILVSVTTTSRREVEWITRCMGRVFPERWSRFLQPLPVAARDGNLAAAYSELLHSDDPTIRHDAARAWCDWEDTHVATHPNWRPDPRYDDPDFRLCFARLVTHYWANAGFLPDGQLLDNAYRLAGIPAVLIGGRLDISGPIDTAWELHQFWPGSELVVIHEAGHGAGHESTSAAIVAAVQRFTNSMSDSSANPPEGDGQTRIVRDEKDAAQKAR